MEGLCLWPASPWIEYRHHGWQIHTNQLWAPILGQGTLRGERTLRSKRRAHDWRKPWSWWVQKSWGTRTSKWRKKNMPDKYVSLTHPRYCHYEYILLSVVGRKAVACKMARNSRWWEKTLETGGQSYVSGKGVGGGWGSSEWRNRVTWCRTSEMQQLANAFYKAGYSKPPVDRYTLDAGLFM